MQREAQLRACEITYATVGTEACGVALNQFTKQLGLSPKWSDEVLLALQEKDKAGEFRWRAANHPFGLLKTIARRSRKRKQYGDRPLDKIVGRTIPLSYFNRSRDGYDGDDEGHSYGRERSNPVLDAAARGVIPRFGRRSNFNIAPPGDDPLRAACVDKKTGKPGNHVPDRFTPPSRDRVLLRDAVLEIESDDAARQWLKAEAIKAGLLPAEVQALLRELRWHRETLKHRARAANRFLTHTGDPKQERDRVECGESPLTHARRVLDLGRSFDWAKIAGDIGLNADESTLLQARSVGTSPTEFMSLHGWDGRHYVAVDKSLRRKMERNRDRLQQVIAEQSGDPDTFRLEREARQLAERWGVVNGRRTKRNLPDLPRIPDVGPGAFNTGGREGAYELLRYAANPTAARIKQLFKKLDHGEVNPR